MQVSYTQDTWGWPQTPTLCMVKKDDTAWGELGLELLCLCLGNSHVSGRVWRTQSPVSWLHSSLPWGPHSSPFISLSFDAETGSTERNTVQEVSKKTVDILICLSERYCMELTAQADELLGALAISFKDPLRICEVLENLKVSRHL